MLKDANNKANNGHKAAGGRDQTSSCALYASGKRIQHCNAHNADGGN